jgi:hypothetical protein
MSKARSTGNISNVIKTSTTCVTVTDGTTDLLIMSGSGRVTIPGDLVVLGGIAGSSAESASYSLSSSFATNANLLDGIDGASFLQTGSFNTFSSSIDTTIKNKLNGDGVISGSVQVDITNTTGYSTFSSSLSSSIGSLSGSVATTTSGLSSSIGSLSSSVATTTSGLAGRITTIEGRGATTGSNVFIGDQIITGSICSNGNIVTTGQIVAQTINVQQVTSSIVYSCGSNIFGNSLTNTQQFTGSMLITGSNMTANVGTACFSGNVCASAFVGGTVSGTSGTFTGKLSVSQASTDFVGEFINTSATNPYGLRVVDASGAANNYPLFQVANNAGTVEYFRVNSGTGLSTFSGVVCSACQICAPSALITNNIIVGTTYGTTAQFSFGSTTGAQTTANLTDAGVRCGILEVLATGGSAGNGGALVLGSDTWGTGIGKGQIALKALLVNGAGCGTSDLAFSLRNDPSCSNLTERMRITVGGCVGINTNNPQSILDVQNCINSSYDPTNTLISNQWFRTSNPSTTACATSGIMFVAQGPGGGNGISTINGVTTSCGSMAITFGTRDASGSVTEKLRIASGGNVGIGTSTPDSVLEIRGSTASPQFRISRSEQINQGLTIQAGGGVTSFNSYDGTDTVFGGYVFNGTKCNTTVERMRITTDGVTCFACQVCLPTSNTSLVAGSYGTISNVGGIDTNIANNAYFDGTDWRRFAAQEAARIYINRDSFSFLRKSSGSAGTTISWDNTLFLGSSGVACFACQVCAPAGIFAPGTSVQIVSGTATFTSGNSGETAGLGSAVGGATPAFNGGCVITSVSFTPKLANSRLLIQTNNVAMWETLNVSDHFYLWASNDTAGNVLTKAGSYLPNFGSSSNNGAIINLNGTANSWGTSTNTISFRAGSTGGTNNYQYNPFYGAAGFNADTVGHFSYTITEIAQ